MRDRLRAAVLIVPLVLLFLSVGAQAQWRKIPTFSTRFFNEVFFIDNDHGWITSQGATVVRTTDAGATWLTSTMPGSPGGLDTFSANRDICFISTSIGFVSGDRGIWKTTDGGASWTRITPSGMETGSASCWFIDQYTGILAVGGGGGDTVASFYRTTDGGSTWNTAYDTVSSGDVAIGGITYISGIFYVSGGDASFWQSTDNGATWSHSFTGMGGWQEDLISYGNRLLIASADGSSSNSTGGGKIRLSTNGGSSWTTSSFPSTVMWGVTLYSSSTGWACGDGGHAYKTTDGGASWSEFSCGMDSTDQIDDICFTDATHGWAVGDGIYKFVGDSFGPRTDTINFGSVLVGTTTGDSSARVRSFGGAGSITSRSIGGMAANQFAATGSLGGQTIPACGDAITPIHFSPTSKGLKIAHLSAVVSGQTDTVRIVLIGRGVQPEIDGPSAFGFDTVECGDTGLDTIVIRNIGDYPLTITDTAFTGTNVRFRLVSPNLPVTIPIGASRAIVVRVTATTTGAHTGQLVLTSNDPDTPDLTINLTAFRKRVTSTILPDTIVTIPAGFVRTDSTICVSYRNTGDGMQFITSVTPISGDTSITVSPAVANVTVQPGGTWPICFKANAADTGWHVRRFRVRTLPCNVDTFITVRFYARSPIIGSVPAKIFPQLLCDAPLRDSIELFNTGNAPLSIDRPIPGGADAADFIVLSPAVWPVTVAPGRSVRVIVQMSQAALPGAKTATLTFPNDDRFPGKNPWVVTLEGFRGSSVIVPEPRIVSLGDVCTGETIVRSVLLKNRGLGDGRVPTVTVLSGSPAVSIAAQPSGKKLAPNDADTVKFRIAPTTAGPFSATFEIRSEPCGVRDTIVVQGNATGILLAANPTTIDFGSAPVGEATTRTVTISNNGDKAASITSLAIVPPIPGAVITAGTLPFTLAPSETVTIFVTITPPAAGALSGSLVAIAEGACRDTLSVPITGLVTIGPARLSAGSYDLGTILSCDSSRADTVVLINSGGSILEVSSMRLGNGANSDFVIVTPPADQPYAIGPDAGVAIIVAFNTLKPGPPGNVSDTLHLEFSSQGQGPLAVPITARRETVALSVFDSAGKIFDTLRFAGLTRCETSQTIEIRLTNDGSIADTVTITSSLAEIETPSAPVIVEPGETRPVTLRANMSASGILNGFVAIHSRPCDIRDTFAVKIVGSATVGSIDGATFPALRIGASANADASLIPLGTQDLTIESATLEDSQGDFALTNDLSGTIVTAGARLPIPLTFTPGAIGRRTARLKIIVSAPCRDTLYAEIVGFGVAGPTKNLDFGQLIPCQDTCTEVFVGFDLASPDERFTILGIDVGGADSSAFAIERPIFPFTIARESLLPVRVCFDPKSVRNDGSGKIIVTATPEGSAVPFEIEIDLRGNRSASVSALDSVTLSANETTVHVRNDGATPITIDGAEISAGFELLTSTPMTISPGDSVPVRVRANGGVNGALVLRHSLPCSDSVVVQLKRNVSEFLVGMTTKPARGRWGTRTSVVLAFRNENDAPLATAVVAVQASPNLLDPVAVRSTNSNVSVERVGFDPKTGIFTFRMSATGGDFIRSSDSLVVIEYDVLRGNEIATALKPSFTEVPAGFSSWSDSSDFALEDWCDAYGRLLDVSGQILLKQNTPNPFNPTTTIEFETAFTSHVKLHVFDASGRIVATLVDEVLPAGRRQIVFDAKDLPSGTYTYRLITGLQVLQRRMVVLK